MFKKRAGARYLKTLKPYERIMAYFMTRRSDAQVFFEDEINCESLDRYIQEKKEQGQDLNYLYIFVAAMVRLYAQRPAMNRFVMNGRLYANEDITICMAVKKSRQLLPTASAPSILPPRLVSPSGSVTVRSCSQPQNAWIPSDVTPSGSCASRRLRQDSKA